MVGPPTNPPMLRCVLWHAPGAAMPGDLLTSLSKRIGHIAAFTEGFGAMAEVCALGIEHGKGGIVLLLIQPERLAGVAEVVTELRTYAPTTLVWKFEAGANPKLAAVVESDVTSWAARGASAAFGGLGDSDLMLSAAKTTPSNDTHSPLPPPAISSPFAPSPPPLPRRAPAAQVTPAASAGSPPQLRLTDSSVPTARPRVPEIVVRPQPKRVSNSRPELTLRGEMPVDAPSSAPVLPPRPTLTAEEMHMLLSDDPIDDAAGRNGHAPPKPLPPSEGRRA